MAAVRCIGLTGSAFGAYYHRLIARGMKGREAMMAVMRKILIVASHLLKTEEMYDPTKVCTVPVAQPEVEPQAPYTPSSAKLVAIGT